MNRIEVIQKCPKCDKTNAVEIPPGKYDQAILYWETDWFCPDHKPEPEMIVYNYE